jgi:type IV pilus assembly protein PilA
LVKRSSLHSRGTGIGSDVGAEGRARRRSGHEDGFTLIELLVVILVIGILAAIAVPSFLNQKSKAVDAQAKELARTAQTAAEAMATDHDGSFKGISPLELNRYEPAIRTTANSTAAYVSAASGGPIEYSVTATASNGDEYTISRSANGETTRSCLSPVSKTGCSGGAQSSW